MGLFSLEKGDHREHKHHGGPDDIDEERHGDDAVLRVQIQDDHVLGAPADNNGEGDEENEAPPLHEGEDGNECDDVCFCSLPVDVLEV